LASNTVWSHTGSDTQEFWDGFPIKNLSGFNFVLTKQPLFSAVVVTHGE